MAFISYLILHSIAGKEVTAPMQPGAIGHALSQTLVKALATFGQYLLPLAFLLGAGMSVYGRFKRGALHEQVATSPDQGALNNMSWQDFEALVGEYFRRTGYTVSETGGGGADGGVDLVMKKDGETFLVQCKQWKAYKVGVSTVRELYGVMAAQGATGGFVITSGVFTDEARAFGTGRNIKLVNGEELHALIREARPAATLNNARALDTSVPKCPVCQSAMTKRTAKRGTNSGNEFWGCTQYPACKGTRPA